LWANGMSAWWANEKSTGSRRPEDVSTCPLIRSCDCHVVEKVAPPGLSVVERESPTAANLLTGIYIPMAPVHQPKAAGQAHIATTTSQHPQRRVNANNGRRTDAGRKRGTAKGVESGCMVQGVEIRRKGRRKGEKSPTGALTESPTTTTGELYTHPQPTADADADVPRGIRPTACDALRAHSTPCKSGPLCSPPRPEPPCSPLLSEPSHYRQPIGSRTYDSIYIVYFNK
jgi:hypothetical protein